LFLVYAQVHAADTHAISTLEAANLSEFKGLIDLAGATAAFSNEKARVTLLAPTNEVRVDHCWAGYLAP
jgi:hypothetical protein